MCNVLLTSSIIILMIAGLRLLFRNKVSSRMIYCLWLPVVVCLLLLPLAYLLTGEPAVLIAYAVAGVPVGSLMAIVWVAGVAALITWFVTTGWFLRKDLRKNAEPFLCPESPVPVWVNPNINTPCLFGLFRPAIYLTPDVAADEESCRHVLAHELTHLRHGDHIWSFVRRLFLCVYWFHPLVWLAVQMSRQDSELACDEGALKRLGEERRLAYGKTIVDLAANASRKGPFLHRCVIGNEALASKAKEKKKELFAAGLGLLLVSAVLIGISSFLTAGEITLQSISVTTVSRQSRYITGQILDTSGLTLQLTFSDGTVREITEGFTCSPTLLETAGTQSITVSYGGKTTCFSVAVYDVKKTGTCGPNLKWFLTLENELFIEGTGPMDDYNGANMPWVEFNERIRNVYLSDGITSIGKCAFCNCAQLTQVQIPDSVTSIGMYAFSNKVSVIYQESKAG